MVANPLTAGIELLQQFGFFTVVIPAILIFALVFGVLEKIKLFAKQGAKDDELKNTRSLHAAIAAVTALLVITQTKIVEFINAIIPNAMALLVVIMLVMLVMGFIGFKPDNPFAEHTYIKYLAVIGAGLIFLCLVGVAMGWKIPIIYQLMQIFIGQEAMPDIAIGQETISMIIAFVVMGIIAGTVLYFIYKQK